MAPSGECLRGKSPPDRMLAVPWRRLFLAAFGLNLFVVCLTDCCDVERCVLKIIKRIIIIIVSADKHSRDVQLRALL